MRQGAYVIGAMVILASLFSFVQEHRSSRVAEALRQLVHTKALVRRGVRQGDGSFTATAVVVATGPATNFGGIARAASAVHEPTSFDVGIHR